MVQSGPHGSRIPNFYGWNQIEMPFVRDKESGLYIAEKSFRDAGIPFSKMEMLASMLPEYIAQNKQIVKVQFDSSGLNGKKLVLSERLRANYDDYLDKTLPGGYNRKEEVEEVLQGPFSPLGFKEFAKTPLLENGVLKERSTRKVLRPEEHSIPSGNDTKLIVKDGKETEWKPL